MEMEVVVSVACRLKNQEMASEQYYLRMRCSWGFVAENSSSFDEEAQQSY